MARKARKNPKMSGSQFIHFIDFEASSLSQDSYPIEAGWAHLDRETGKIISKGVLIKPETNWTDWNPVSEAIHGIPLSILERDGETALSVAERLNSAFGGDVVLCDGGDYDAHWASRLYEAAGITRSWTIGDFMQNIAVYRLGDDIPMETWMALRERFSAPRPHRAAADAKFLAQLYWDAPNL